MIRYSLPPNRSEAAKILIKLNKEKREVRITVMKHRKVKSNKKTSETINEAIQTPIMCGDTPVPGMSP